MRNGYINMNDEPQKRYPASKLHHQSQEPRDTARTKFVSGYKALFGFYLICYAKCLYSTSLWCLV